MSNCSSHNCLKSAFICYNWRTALTRNESKHKHERHTKIEFPWLLSLHNLGRIRLANLEQSKAITDYALAIRDSSASELFWAIFWFHPQWQNPITRKCWTCAKTFCPFQCFSNIDDKISFTSSWNRAKLLTFLSVSSKWPQSSYTYSYRHFEHATILGSLWYFAAKNWHILHPSNDADTAWQRKPAQIRQVPQSKNEESTFITIICLCVLNLIYYLMIFLNRIAHILNASAFL